MIPFPLKRPSPTPRRPLAARKLLPMRIRRLVGQKRQSRSLLPTPRSPVSRSLPPLPTLMPRPRSVAIPPRPLLLRLLPSLLRRVLSARLPKKRQRIPSPRSPSEPVARLARPALCPKMMKLLPPRRPRVAGRRLPRSKCLWNSAPNPPCVLFLHPGTFFQNCNWTRGGLKLPVFRCATG